MHKVEAIAARGYISKNFITLDVFEDEVHVLLLVADDSIRDVHVLDRHHKIVSIV